MRQGRTSFAVCRSLAGRPQSAPPCVFAVASNKVLCQVQLCVCVCARARVQVQMCECVTTQHKQHTHTLAHTHTGTDGDVDMAFGSKRPASGTVGGEVEGKKEAKTQVLGFYFCFWNYRRWT